MLAGKRKLKEKMAARGGCFQVVFSRHETRTDILAAGTMYSWSKALEARVLVRSLPLSLDCSCFSELKRYYT